MLHAICLSALLAGPPREAPTTRTSPRSAEDGTSASTGDTSTGDTGTGDTSTSDTSTGDTGPGPTHAAQPGTQPPEAQPPTSQSTQDRNPDHPSAAASPEEYPSTEDAAADPSTRAPSTPKGFVLDHVLPCGTRVLIARDESLPVAAVVLAIEAGLEDDPKDAPGLTHALAHHLQQGNRRLRPGAALDAVHAQGGLASMAVGARQVRFESLIPAFALTGVLQIEAIRLVHPTLDDGLWQRSLDAARRDHGARPPVDEAVWAAAWAQPSLAHARRARDSALAKRPAAARREAMQQLFTPPRATLVVISPDEPRAVLAAVAAAFSDLPASPRSLPSPSPEATSLEGLRELPRRPSTGAARKAAPRPARFVAAVRATTPSGQAVGDEVSSRLARVLCGTLNRQEGGVTTSSRPSASRPSAGRLTPGDGSRQPGHAERVRCTTFDDPRRPLLVVDVTSTRSARAVLAERLARIADGSDAALVEAQRERQRALLARETQTPLGLARALARSAPASAALDATAEVPNDGSTHADTNPSAEVVTRPWSEVVGLDALSDQGGMHRALAGLLDANAWWQLVEPVPVDPTPAPTPAPSEGSAGASGATAREAPRPASDGSAAGARP